MVCRVDAVGWGTTYCTVGFGGLSGMIGGGGEDERTRGWLSTCDVVRWIIGVVWM